MSALPDESTEFLPDPKSQTLVPLEGLLVLLRYGEADGVIALRLEVGKAAMQQSVSKPVPLVGRQDCHLRNHA